MRKLCAVLQSKYTVLEAADRVEVALVRSFVALLQWQICFGLNRMSTSWSGELCPGGAYLVVVWHRVWPIHKTFLELDNIKSVL